MSASAEAVLPGAAGTIRPRARARAWRSRLVLLGPAFVAAVAYVDPGNFATNITAGSKYGYLLLWVILAANLMAMLIQYLSAKVGIATGRSLPELCRERFPRPRRGRALDPGRADRHGHRPGRVRGRRDRPQPAVRSAALSRGAHHRGGRVRDPGPRGPRPPPLRDHDRRPARRDPARLRLRAGPHRSRSGGRRRRVRARLRGDRERAPRHRDPGRHRHAARDLPAFGAHPGPLRGSRRGATGAGCCASCASMSGWPWGRPGS